jgi:phenylalanyl-tRNA synthetase alpha chain
MRWNSEYFPFTDPSFELEVEFNGKWMEVLGCGVIHREVLTNSLRAQDYGWAFGLGLERLAMILFDIPDIRLFWSTDERFLSQFQSGKVIKFIPYSKFPQCYKDVSFWLPPASNVNSKEDSIHPNDIYELMREIAGDLVEKVELIDQFQHPKTLKKSHAYRITYRSMDRNLTNKEIDEIQWKVRDELVKKLKVELR